MNDQIKAAAHLVARVEFELKAAQDTAEHMQAKADELSGRLQAIEAKKDGIRAEHAAGTLTSGQAGGAYEILADDAADLVELRKGAQAAAAAAHKEVEDVGVRHAAALRELEKAEKVVKFDLLADHVAEIERTLCNAVSALHALGLGVGKPQSLTASWRASAALRNAITLGVVPKGGEA